MIGIEQTIWAAAFANAFVAPDIVADGVPMRTRKAKRLAWLAVAAFREPARNILWHGFNNEAETNAEAMYREMCGSVESERLSIQKEMVRGLIQYIEGRVEQITRPHPNHDMDFYKLKNEVALEELRSLVGELNAMLNG